MHSTKYPFAVRLIGFEPTEARMIAAMLSHTPQAGPSYHCLMEESLQEPDLFIANGDELKALTALAALNPSKVQPALIVGATPVALPYPQLMRPFDAARINGVLAEMMMRRADALSLLTAAGMPVLSERRRRERLDFDLTEPSEYAAMRRPPPCGAVLVIDKGGAFRDHAAKLLGHSRVSIEWTDSASTAVRLCDETPVSLVIINTSTPDIDPYGLCRAIKGLSDGSRIAVVFLVGATFTYDSDKARVAGVRGLLDKPVADRHLLATLKKLLSLPM